MTLIMIMQLSRYRSGGQDLACNAHLSKLDELNPIKNAIINVKCRFSVWLQKLVPEEMTRDEVDVWNINEMMSFCGVWVVLILEPSTNTDPEADTGLSCS